MEEKSVEIKQVSEREIWVGESRFFLGEDGILYETMVVKNDEKTVLAFMDASNILISNFEGKIKFCIDLNKAEQSTSEARKKGWRRLDDERYGKIAFFGIHPVARVLASFFMGVTKKKDTRFFKSKEDALAWLKE